ncbi:MAG: hypothetical protein WD970_03020 [Patescibacteria group bacterium]
MATDGQKDSIRATVLQAVSTQLQTMTFDDAEQMIDNPKEVNGLVGKIFEPFVRTKSVLYWLDEMTRFYGEVFGLECDFPNIRVPISREGFDWLLIMDERISTQAAYEACQKQFNCWKYTDRSLDDAVPVNDRDQSKGTYAIWLRDTVEADEVHRNKSANDLKAANISGITLRERLILELWYFWKTQKHLDVQNWTLCSGSRYDDGDVPSVGWGSDGSRVDVIWFRPDGRDDSLRVREVVS